MSKQSLSRTGGGRIEEKSTTEDKFEEEKETWVPEEERDQIRSQSTGSQEKKR